MIGNRIWLWGVVLTLALGGVSLTGCNGDDANGNGITDEVTDVLDGNGDENGNGEE